MTKNFAISIFLAGNFSFKQCREKFLTGRKENYFNFTRRQFSSSVKNGASNGKKKRRSNLLFQISLADDFQTF